MGRPPKPNAELKLHGTYRKDRHGDEPQATGQLVKPEGLDPAESWFWDQHVEQVKANGAAGGDLAVFLSACNWWAIAKALEKEAKNPKCDYRTFIKLSMAWKNWRAAMASCGLSPVDRARLKQKPAKKETSKARFFGK